MKKNYKNKNIKIFITSLICGLAFTFVNVNAMNDSDSEVQQQQISQEVNNDSNSTNNDNNNSNIYNTENENNQQTLKNNENQPQDNNNNFNTINTTSNDESKTIEQNDYDFNKKMQEKEILFDIIEENIKDAFNLIRNENIYDTNMILRYMIYNFKQREKYLNKYEIEYYKNKINQIAEMTEYDITDKMNTNEDTNTLEQDDNDNDFNEKMEGRMSFFAKYRNHYKIAEECLKNNQLDIVDNILKMMISDLNDQENYLDENEIEYFNNKITEISEINKNKKIDDMLNEMEGYYQEGIVKLRDKGDFKNAEKELKSLIKAKNSYKKYLNETNLRTITREINELEKIIRRRKILNKFNNYFKMVKDQIEAVNYDDALETIERINLYKDKNKSYIEDDLMKEYENRIKELKENINEKQKIRKIGNQLALIQEDVASNIDSGNLTDAYHKIRIIEDIITKNREKLEEEYNNLNEFETKTEEMKKQIKNIETKKELKKKKNS